MNKTAIKNYAIWARVQLIESARQRAFEYEITEDGQNDPELKAVSGRVLTSGEINQRKELISLINQKGFDQVMEEAAYTWFNRFIALRFMEVNGYLPTKVRVFTDENNEFKPDILKEAMSIDLEGIDRDKVFAYLDEQDNEGLYKYLLITQCNALNKNLPYMFEQISNWTELLFPANLLRPDGVLGQMISEIPEEDWEDAVQIIGWLYQYYNSELKDDTFAKLKHNVKISKERIPAATQLFTPDWIVRYMVENSLGRLWYEGHRNFDKSEWRYYLDEAEQEPEVEEQLKAIREEYSKMRPEEITVIDPCMGSGHILVYAFDVLVQIYTSCGWSERDAARSILENNLYGLDIDDRAGQIAYFAVMMKARKYSRRILTQDIKPKVMAIQESNGISIDLERFGDWKETAEKLINELNDAKEYGSILNLSISQEELSALKNKACEILDSSNSSLLDIHDNKQIAERLIPLIEEAEIMIQKYDAVITNPPYMGGSGMSAKLSSFVKKNYKDSKSDLFAVFIEKCAVMTKQDRYQAMITQHAWMFLSSYENLRIKLLSKNTINMIHLGARAFDEIGGEVVQTTSFVIQNSYLNNRKGVFCRLIEPTTENGKREMFLSGNKRYESAQDNFSKIPGSPIAYWVSKAVKNVFIQGTPLSSIAAPRKGNSTSDNGRFLRLWYEVDSKKMNLNAKKIIRKETKERRWYPYNKGGGYRKWYGFNDYLIDWYDDAAEIRRIKTAVIANYQYFMKPGLTWSTVTSSKFSVRWFGDGYIFDNGGCCIFELGEMREYLCGLLNSVVFTYIFGQLNPTVNFQSGEVAKFPILGKTNETIKTIVKESISLSQYEYDCYESSRDFKKHPLL